jgi:hypothetical protein
MFLRNLLASAGMIIVVAALAIGIGFSSDPVIAQGGEDFTTDFRLEDCSFSAKGRNPYFSLEPGYQLVLEGEDEGETVRLVVTVLGDKEAVKLDGVPKAKPRVVEEREWADDELVEVSRNFFSICDQTNDIFYFGEDVDIYEDGEVVSHDGAWRAGQNGALPGLIMPNTYLLGSRYFQEIAPGVALDQAEHVAMGLEVSVPAGTFSNCVEVRETTPLEPGSESIKRYCPNVGLVFDDGVELVDFGFNVFDLTEDEEEGGEEGE